MIGQINEDAGRNAEVRNLASAANAAAAEPTERVADKVLPRLNRGEKPVPKTQRIADAQALEAHAERRHRLAAQVRVENPSRTEEEIEERLAQFGV